MPTTRAAVARQLEDNLKVTLLELKKCQATNEQLLAEREDSEKEVLLIINKNLQLKNEMAEMHGRLLDVTGERDQLQRLVDGFDQSSSTFEDSLRRISLLEKELRAAHNEITSLQGTIEDLKSVQTQTLFEELITPPTLPPPVVISAVSPSQQYPTIDLTSDTSINSISITNFNCSIKTKTCVKINNYIKKTRKLINRNKRFCKNLNCSKERISLINEIESYRISLENNLKSYECDTRRLQSEMLTLKSSLEHISGKYDTAQKEIKEHVLATNSLLQFCKKNHYTSQSLIDNHQNDCVKTLTSCSAAAVCPVADQTQLTLTQAPLIDTDNGTAFSLPMQTEQQNNIVMFSDELGKNMGLQLSKRIGQPVLNNCIPGATYLTILKSVLASQLSENTILIIFIGRRENATKKDMAKCLSEINSLKNVKKVILFAFPFCQNHVGHENIIRHHCNLYLHTLTCRNSDKFHFIDTNNFIGKYFYTRKDRYCLSKYYTRQIAELLSYYIINSANLLANKTTASIEQNINNNSNINIQPLESVPSTLN